MSETELRDELCKAMESLSKTAPVMRIGQLMAAAGELCADLHGRGLWDAEDDELLEAVWKLKGDLEQHAPSELKESA